MNKTIETAYQNALMADAAYIDFKRDPLFLETDGADNSLYRITNNAEVDFLDRGFTQEQFEAFQKRYRIPKGGYEFDQASGFDAVVFVDTQNNDKKTIAFRGTEATGTYGNVDVGDLFQDINLALGLSGLGEWLAGALTPEWLQGKLRENGFEKSADFLGILGSASQDFDRTAFLKKLGLLDKNGKPVEGVETVNITGHSLGGNLALHAASSLGALADQTITFNGAGMAGLDAALAQGDNRITNYFSIPGWQVTAGEVGEDLSLFQRKGLRH